MKVITVPKGKKIYFASDNHLGAPTAKASMPREKKFVQWLDTIKHDAEAVFLLGDLFDFWFEYKYVVPKGFTRVLGKLAELSDQGIKIHFFVGNHDLWMNGYFEEELGISVYHQPEEFTFNATSFFIGHGDGLGPKDKGFKRLKKVFTNSFFKWLYRWIHPDIGVRFAQYLSVKNKVISGDEDVKFLGWWWWTGFCALARGRAHIQQPRGTAERAASTHATSIPHAQDQTRCYKVCTVVRAGVFCL